MERKVKLYIGNAAKYKPENYYELDDYTVTDSGDVFDSNGEKLKEYKIYGYKYVRLIIKGKEKKCKVHRIVATTFRDICGDFNEVVNHLDENKDNNSAFNLRWVTDKENRAWGTIKERTKQTIAKKMEIKNAVEKFCKEHNIPLPPRKDIILKKTSKRYIIKDKSNSIVLYTQGFEPIIVCSKKTTARTKSEPQVQEKQELTEVKEYLDCLRYLSSLYDKFI